MTPEGSTSSEVVWSAGDLAGDPHARADKAERVRRMFSAIAHAYDLNNRVHSMGRDQAWRRRAVREAAAGPRDEVLDVACGTGDLAEAFAALARPAAVVGLDFTEPMLALARRKAAGRRRRAGEPLPRYVHGDAMDLPFGPGSFDVVSIAFGIRNVADPDRALAEFRRVLRPGGRLVVLEFGRPANRLLARLHDFYCARVMPVTAAILARDRSGAYRYLPRSVETFAGPQELARRIECAAFQPPRVLSLSLGICLLYVAGVAPVAPAAAPVVSSANPASASGPASDSAART